MNEYQIQQVEPQSKVIQARDGKLYQVTLLPQPQQLEQRSIELDESELRRMRRMQRERIDRDRNNTANTIGYACMGIGAVVVGLIALMMAGAIFASATKPSAPEITNPYCERFCF